MISTEKKQEILGEYRKHEKDTGSSEVQVALLSARIRELTEHFKIHRKDHASRRGLLKLVGRRRKLLDFMKRTEPEEYRSILARLNLRK